MVTKVDEGVAFAALGLAVAETVKIYRETAPALSDCRAASPDDAHNWEIRQAILDADILALIVVVAIGGGGLVLIRRLYPLLLGLAAVLLMSAYYRSVVRSSNGKVA